MIYHKNISLKILNYATLQKVLLREVEKECRNKLLSFVQKMDAESIVDLQDVYKMIIGAVHEGGLEAELDDQLGYPKYDYRNKMVDNSRNSFNTYKQILATLRFICQAIKKETLNRSLQRRIKQP